MIDDRPNATNPSEATERLIDRLQRTNIRNYMLLSGTMTQFLSCLQNPSDPFCPGANNTPSQGWSQLYLYLNYPTVLQPTLNHSTDIGAQELFVP
jgi:hypothetical protein